MKKILSLIALVLLVTCAISGPGVPGHIYESTSKFDNSKEISMEPAWLYCDSLGIKLRLYKSSKMDKNEVVMVAIVQGAHNFSKGESLHFNIDGDIVSFVSMDDLTDFKTASAAHYGGVYFPPVNWSSKRYLVTMDFIERINNANKVMVKVDLTKSYVEGTYSVDGYTTARPAFRDFCNRVSTW